MVRRFYLLDILRGLAAICVVFSHYQHFFIYKAPGQYAEANWDRTAQPLFGLLKALYISGGQGVALFFALSGFIFFSQYLDGVSARRVSGWRFFVLRFSRLYPLHIVTLLLVAAMQWWSIQADDATIIYACYDVENFALNLLLAMNWRHEICWSFNGPAWSISIEAMLYVTFFLFSLYVPRAAWAKMVLAIVMASVGNLMLENATAGWGLIGLGILGFYAGGFVALFLERLIALGTRPVVIAVAAAALCALAYEDYCQAGTRVLLYGVTFPALVLSLAALQHASAGLGRQLRGLGDISYAVYMVHFPIQLALLLGWNLGVIHLDYREPAAFFLFFAVLFGVSILTYYLFERPVQDYLRRKMLRTKTQTIAVLAPDAI